MKLLLPVIGMSLFLTGCSIAWSFQDISETPSCKEWVGKEIKAKEELLIIHDSQSGDNFILRPFAQFYPTIEEYRKFGKNKKHLMDDRKIIGIVEKDEIFIIKSIGYIHRSTIGKIELMLVSSKKSGNLYYLEGSDLFSLNGNSLLLYDEFEVLPISPAIDSKK